MVQRAVNGEAKAGLRSSIMIWDADSRCPRGHHLSHNISAKVQTQDLIAKELKPEESKPKESKPVSIRSFALSRTDSNEPAKPSH